MAQYILGRQSLMDALGLSGIRGLIQVSSDGRVFTLFKGNVFEEGAHGDRKLMAGRDGHWYTWNSPIENVPAGNVRDFRVDTHGNLYSVQGGRVVVNSNSLTGLELGWQALRVDDSGNVYKTEDRFLDGTYLTRTNVLPDAANADRIAAPEAGS
ncbi:MAG: hypothetical protein KKH28_08655 [Elusimicrobia bacterium]|nr:hypothetical protein [Elusimicrobiota bacterium]